MPVLDAELLKDIFVFSVADNMKKITLFSGCGWYLLIQLRDFKASVVLPLETSQAGLSGMNIINIHGTIVYMFDNQATVLQFITQPFAYTITIPEKYMSAYYKAYFQGNTPWLIPSFVIHKNENMTYVNNRSFRKTINNTNW